MTVTAQTPINTHVATGASAVFGYDFLVRAASDMAVFLDDVELSAADFSVSGVGTPSGGTVTLNVTPAAGVVVVTMRRSVLQRITDYQTLGDFRASVVNPDFDRIWLAMQEILSGNQVLRNVLRVPRGEFVPALPNAAARANTLMGFDASGNPIVTTPGAGSAEGVALDLAQFIADVANTTDPAKGPGMLGYGGGLAYPEGSLGWRVRQFRTFKDFGAVGDGVADDTAAIQAAMNSNAAVYDDSDGATYRLTASVSIPNSAFTRFIGSGNKPIQRSAFFVDFSGPGFKGAAGTTAFYCFENFYCYSTPAHAAAQFLDHDGDSVHCILTNLTLRNFKGKAIDLASAFRCQIDFLGQYCWDYMLKISAGSATWIKFTADHSYAGGIDVLGGGFTIEPYTEAICTDNDPAGANASWREMIIRGAQHTITGGVLNVHAQNNKFPIEIAVARAITFVGVRGFSLGAAPHWINVNATDSSITLLDCPDFTVGGTTQNVMVMDSGYTTTRPDITLSGQSLRNSTARVWCCFDGVTGANKQASGITAVTRNGVGDYRLTFPAFANANYAVSIAAAKSGTVVAARYTGKLAGQIDIQVNNTASTAAVDADELSVILMGV